MLQQLLKQAARTRVSRIAKQLRGRQTQSVIAVLFRTLGDHVDRLRVVVLSKGLQDALDFSATEAADPNWTAFLTLRAADEQELSGHLDSLPLSKHLQFQVSRIAPSS